MKNAHLKLALMASAMVATCLAAPAMAQNTEHDHSHGAASPASTPAPAQKAASKPAGAPAAGTPSAGTADQGMMMDMKAMCDMHKNMMAMHTPAERQAMVDKEMPGMSSKDKQMRMTMMDEHCK